MDLRHKDTSKMWWRLHAELLCSEAFPIFMRAQLSQGHWSLFISRTLSILPNAYFDRLKARSLMSQKRALQFIMTVYDTEMSFRRIVVDWNWHCTHLACNGPSFRLKISRALLSFLETADMQNITQGLGVAELFCSWRQTTIHRCWYSLARFWCWTITIHRCWGFGQIHQHIASQSSPQGKTC